MEFLNREIAGLPRTGNFPFRVGLLYMSGDLPPMSLHGETPKTLFEVNIRLDSESGICHDIINGSEIHAPYPHAVYKMPGGRHDLFIEKSRNCIAFGYSAGMLEEFRRLGMYPEGSSKTFFLSEEIKRHVRNFRKLCRSLYSPGAADEIDWVCFQLYREIFYSDTAKSETQSEFVRIKNLSIWFQLHFHEEINLDEIARQNGFSHATFFRKWKQIFRETPVQYILNLKMAAAASLLRETKMPIYQIIRDVRFSGMTQFYRRFECQYGMTPDQFRKLR